MCIQKDSDCNKLTSVSIHEELAFEDGAFPEKAGIQRHSFEVNWVYITIPFTTSPNLKGVKLLHAVFP